MNNPTLSLEVLNGPLDGCVITLEDEEIWGKTGEGPLIFPWDKGLGEQQARFFPEAGQWWIETYDAPHSTYCLNDETRIRGKKSLTQGERLKASDTWLVVKQIG